MESNRLLGNTDPHFGDVVSVVTSRLALIDSVGAERAIVMVPQLRDEFLDLDQGKITAKKEKYGIWPQELRPT